MTSETTIIDRQVKLQISSAKTLVTFMENYIGELEGDIDQLKNDKITEPEFNKKWNIVMNIMNDYIIKFDNYETTDSVIKTVISGKLFLSSNPQLKVVCSCEGKKTLIKKEHVSSITNKMKHYGIENIYLDLDEVETIGSIKSDLQTGLRHVMTFTIYTKDSLLKTYPFMSNKMDNFQEVFGEKALGLNFLVGKEQIDHDKFGEFWVSRFENISNPLLTRKYGKSNNIKKCCLDYYFDE